MWSPSLFATSLGHQHTQSKDNCNQISVAFKKISQQILSCFGPKIWDFFNFKSSFLVWIPLLIFFKNPKFFLCHKIWKKKKDKKKTLGSVIFQPSKGASRLFFHNVHLHSSKQPKQKRRMMWNMPQSCAQLNGSCVSFHQSNNTIYSLLFRKRNKSEPLSLSLIGRVNIYDLRNFFSQQLIWYIPTTSHNFWMIALCNDPHHIILVGYHGYDLNLIWWWIRP